MPSLAKDKRRPLVAFVIGALLVLTFWRSRSPQAQATDAPRDIFSAGRAVAQLAAVLDGVGPHPVGSVANAQVRERIAARLTELGFDVRTTRHVGCSSRGICSELDNLVALREAGPDVLLLAGHYDSVGAGVGAADDGAAVAALLETARLIATDAEPPSNTVAILLTDGEEAGLLGARAFVAHDPIFRRVRAVVNLEARGTTGPSLMFEAGGRTGAIVEHLRALDRPNTSSLFAAVYELLPNDTDFSVFREHGAAGFNFAFIDGVARYHTALDDLEHLDHGSVQHHGDNVWALTRSLRGADLGALHRGDDAIWFDVLGLGLVSWPARYAVPLSLGSLALLAFGAVTHVRRRRARWADLRRSTGVALVTPILAALVGALLGVVITLPSTSSLPRMSATLVPFVALASGSAAAALALSRLLVACDGWSRFYGLWILWSALGLVVALAFPPGCYLFVAPAIVAALMGSFGGRGDVAPAAVVGIVCATMLWASVAIGLVSALGLAAPFLIAAALGFAFSAALPMLADGRSCRRSVISLGAFAACLAVAAAIVSPYDEVEPQRMSIVHAQDEDASHWWIDSSWGALPDPLLRALPGYEETEPPLPLVGIGRAVVADGPSLALAAPEVERLPSVPGGLRLRIVSSRGAWGTGILFPPTVALPMVTVVPRPS
ncbi:MAG: M28 family peptidase, partial [Polyangiaceae bacterium]